MFLEHINLTVSNLERSIGFYQAAFGFKVRWRGTTTDGMPAAHVGDDRCYLALFAAAEPEPTARDYSRVGFNHFGFVVDDLAQTRDRLNKLGVQPHLEADYEPGRRLYFGDPDGVEVEVVEYERSSSTNRTKENR